jgi:prevent-host-death family protein
MARRSRGAAAGQPPPRFAALTPAPARATFLAKLAKQAAMAEIVNMHQAKSSLSRLVEKALAGEEVVIARHGEPLVKLVPITKELKPRIPGRSKGKIWIAPDCFEPMSEEDLALWEKWDR